MAVDSVSASIAALEHRETIVEYSPEKESYFAYISKFIADVHISYV